MMKMTYRPFIWIVLFFAIGIGLTKLIQISFVYLVISILAMLYAALRFIDRRYLSVLCVLLMLSLLGSLWVQSFQYVSDNHISRFARFYRQKPIVVKGVVVSDIQRRESTRGKKNSFTLAIKEVKSPWGWKEREGKILVNIFRDANINYGDLIHIEGKLHRPFNFSPERNFSYSDYLQHRGIYYILSVKKNVEIDILSRGEASPIKEFLLSKRNKLKKIFNTHLTKNEAGIIRAIILGDRAGIPKHIRELFVQTGTAHILAISGLHVGVIVGLFLVFTKLFPIGRKSQLVLTVVLLIFYASLTGGRPSVVRATIMAVVFLTSYIVEQEPDLLNTLSLAAFLILLVNPMNLYDIGFQLSFACVLSIIIINKRVKPLVELMAGRPRSKLVKVFIDSLSVSASIWIGIFGLIAFYFNIVTPITIVANLFVIPLISVVVALGFGLLFAGLIIPPAIFLFAICLKLALNLMVAVIFLFAKVPGAFVHVDYVSIWYIITYYAIIIALCSISSMIDKPQRVC